VLLDDIGIAQIVVEEDAGIVDEDVERVDLGGGPLDLRSTVTSSVSGVTRLSAC
jgi:hypothetical protein